jgi:hypothetical protein
MKINSLWGSPVFQNGCKLRTTARHLGWAARKLTTFWRLNLDFSVHAGELAFDGKVLLHLHARISSTSPMRGLVMISCIVILAVVVLR